MDVSVIIAAYNAAPTIFRAIDSVLKQTLQPREIIVVDDASTDNTREIVTELSQCCPSVRLITLKENAGPSTARNVAINAAEGEWVAILDGDDAWKANRLERFSHIAKVYDVDFIADNQVLYDLTAAREGRRAFEASWRYQILDLEMLYHNDTLDTGKTTYPPLKPIIRRKFLRERKITYDESIFYGEDFKLNAEILFNGGRAILTSEPLYIYSTRLGEFSKRVSPISKSIPRFDLMIKMSDELVEKYKPAITPKLATVIAYRRSQSELVHYANIAREYRRKKKYLSYLGYVLSRFSLFIFLSKRLFRKFASRIE